MHCLSVRFDTFQHASPHSEVVIVQHFGATATISLLPKFDFQNDASLTMASRPALMIAMRIIDIIHLFFYEKVPWRCLFRLEPFAERQTFQTFQSNCV